MSHEGPHIVLDCSIRVYAMFGACGMTLRFAVFLKEESILETIHYHIDP